MTQQCTNGQTGSPERSQAVIGLALSHEQFPTTQLVELGVQAEQAGFAAVWASDHFHPWQDNQAHCSLAWVTLAALGQRTQRLLLGTGVTCPSYRYRPQIVAQAFASLGLLYPGRVFLGVGSGEAVKTRFLAEVAGETTRNARRFALRARSAMALSLLPSWQLSQNCGRRLSRRREPLESNQHRCPSWLTMMWS